MGLDANATKLLISATRAGVDFSRTATIGRQTLYVPTDTVRSQLDTVGIELEKGIEWKSADQPEPFADEFFKKLGAGTLHSFDASDYEGADIVSDFNLPIDPSRHQKYSAVVDSGSLEHVFNFPVAIRNCMEMVEEGGHFVGITPANNFFGHGFYQFSPELYFRIFSEANGFEVQQMIVYEESYAARFYEVVDPEALRRRVALVNNRPTHLFVVARRNQVVPVFATPPQQSDYSATWSTACKDSSTREQSEDKPKQRSALRERVSAWLTRRKYRRIQSLDNRDFFKPFDP